MWLWCGRGTAEETRNGKTSACALQGSEDTPGMWWSCSKCLWTTAWERNAHLLSSWTRGIEFRKSHALDGGRPVPLCCPFPVKMNLGTSRIAYQFVIQGAAKDGVWCKQQEHTNLLDCDPFSVVALNTKRKCRLSSEADPENELCGLQMSVRIQS